MVASCFPSTRPMTKSDRFKCHALEASTPALGRWGTPLVQRRQDTEWERGRQAACGHTRQSKEQSPTDRAQRTSLARTRESGSLSHCVPRLLRAVRSVDRRGPPVTGKPAVHPYPITSVRAVANKDCCSPRRNQRGCQPQSPGEAAPSNYFRQARLNLEFGTGIRGQHERHKAEGLGLGLELGLGLGLSDCLQSLPAY